MPTTATVPRAASEQYRRSLLLAAAAASAAQRERPRGLSAVAAVIIRYQATAALQAELAVAQILAEQNIDREAEAILNSLSFTTETDRLMGMVQATVDQEFDQLVESLVQDAARAAESVSITARPDVAFVRYLNPPSCARCTVLAGRVYRFSQGFLRHPNCDCVMIPTTVAAGPDLVQDPVALALAGQVRGLSQKDLLAIEDGADFGRIVNIRSKKAGLREAGRVLARNGKLTPEGIYRLASDRAEAVRLLRQFGYFR